MAVKIAYYGEKVGARRPVDKNKTVTCAVMKRLLVIGLCMLCVQWCAGQQLMYANLDDLLADRADTATTLRVLHRTKKQIYTLGGADYRIVASENSGLSRYLKSRCYAVRIDGQLYVNCKKMRYGKYRFGRWYAPAVRIGDRIFFQAQPLGQLAASSLVPVDAVRLGGEFGNAIAVSNLVNDRVYYEIDAETGRCEFLGKARMHDLLAPWPDKQTELAGEPTESAAIMLKYLFFLRQNAE